MGKTAVVTGGSRGIGKAIALKLAKEGYDIALNYASNDEAAKAACEEISALGVRCEIIGSSGADMVNAVNDPDHSSDPVYEAYELKEEN